MLFALAVFAPTGLASGSASAEAVLHRGNGSDPQTLDPAHASFDVEANILYDLGEGLTTYDAAGEVIPGDAESWTVSADGLTYTFKIRDSAEWSNGDPVTAGDYVYSFRRLEDPKEAAGHANVLYPIKNAAVVNTAKPNAPVDSGTLGVQALDAKTLRITLEQPTPYFLTLLAEPAALPVYRPAVEQYAADFVRPGNLVSNGAFTLAEDVANDHITLVRNPHFWDAPDVKLDRVIFYPTDDQAAAVKQFQAGTLDVNYRFPTAEIKALGQSLGADQIHLTPTLSTYAYAFDQRQPPFDDPRVRQALSMAIDRVSLAQSISAGSALPLYSFVPPGLPGYAPALPDFNAMSPTDRMNKATQLLQDAGYGPSGKPLSIEIRYAAGANRKKLAAAIADMWRQLGAAVTMVSLDTKSHYDYLQSGGSFDAAGVAWSADYPDPEAFLSEFVSTDKTFDYGGYADAKFDSLMQQSYAEPDAAARLQILHDAEAQLTADSAAAPLLVSAAPWLVSRRVHGWQDNTVNVHPSRFLSLDR